MAQAIKNSQSIKQRFAPHNHSRKIKKDCQKVPPDKKTSWGKRERYSFGYAVFLILALMK